MADVVSVWLGLLIVVLLGLRLVVHLLRRDATPRAFPLPPGPRGWGAFRSLAGAMWTGRLHVLAYELSRQYGELVLCQTVVGNLCFINSTRLARQVFGNRGLEDSTNNRPETAFGRFVMASYHDVATSDTDRNPAWIKMRKIFFKAVKYYGDGVDHMEDLIQVELERMVSEIQAARDHDLLVNDVIATTVACHVTTMITGEHPDDRLIRSIHKLVDISNDILNPIFDEVLNACPWLRHVPFTRYERVCSEATKVRKDVLQQLFAVTKKSYVANEPRGIIHLLWDEQAKADNQWLNDVSVEGLLMDVIVGGVLTSTQLINGMMFYLTHHPEVRRRLQQELDDVIGRRSPKLRDKSSLPYLEAVMLEAHRVCHVVPLGLPHETRASVDVEGYTIPRGCRVFSNVYTYDRDPEVYPDPAYFRPERFLDSEGQLLSATHPTRLGLLPFGVGKRVCPGMTFAKARAILVVATFLQKFDVDPPRDRPLLPLAPSSWTDAITFTLTLRPFHLVCTERM